MQDIKEKLAAVMANIEERTESELIAVVKGALIAAGTGTPIGDINDQYIYVYNQLDRRLDRAGAPHDNQFDDLWAFYSFWKENGLDTYASRRSFIRKLYKGRKTELDVVWSFINPAIRTVAKPRFDNGHYADAVEASFKEINGRIKEMVRQEAGKDLDGSALMNHAFSVKSPMIVLEDLETESGKNVQNGYMQIFAGAMTGIRNPRAHENHDTSKEEAIPLIYLAGHLFDKFEEALKNRPEPQLDITNSSGAAQSDQSKHTRKLYLRLKEPDDHRLLIEIRNRLMGGIGTDPVILVLGDGKKSAIRLPMMADASSSSLISSLKTILGEDNVVVRRDGQILG